ncbi:arginine deiminase family protein [Emergencia timonensis]|uniref:dimethylarginine dimethylaminohydrolase family protein n=1 Tax=Emergencia timonensis TaxID=1776384 RepID=UPI00082CADE9|nr:arginine deiminase family protein [Emergencia timonensis]WNX87671.1 arginine deiminase family protein [Emergencia timonensis]
MAFLELNKDKNLRRDETPFEEQIRDYWGDWGISSQCAPLKSVLLRRPGSEINEFSWEEARFREGIDPDKFREAHQRLVDLYEENGVKVYFLDEQREDRPNAVYCRDLMFMTPEGAIIARPALPVRRGEEVAMAKALAALNIPIVKTITGTGTFEGADCLWVDRKTAILARSSRTNETGYNQVAQVLREQGVETILTVPIPYTNAHLDGIMNFVDTDKAIVNTRQVPYDVVEYLMNRGYNIIDAPDQDEARFSLGLNIVALRPGVVIQAQGNPKTKEALEKNGVEVISLDFDEILKGWGSVHCCSATLARG